MRRSRVILSTLAAGVALLIPAAASAAPEIQTLPIPPLPTDLLSESFTGTPATKQPISHPAIPAHPYLGATGTNSMHNDAYASDAYRGERSARPRPAGAARRRTASASAPPWLRLQARIVGLCGGLEGFS